MIMALNNNLNWNQVQDLLRNNIHINSHLTPRTNFKIVREVPPYHCRNYNDSEGFRVQVGATNYINIPLEMLRVLFESTRLNNNTYNRVVFRENFPRELNNTPCYVHSVGKLFECVRVMRSINQRDYIIVN